MRTLKDTTTDRLRVLRKERGFSQQALADKLGLLGTQIDRTAIAKIEAGTRELSLSEAFQFAQALDVAPVHLFVPVDADPDEEIALGENMTAGPEELRAWIRGDMPLFPQDPRIYFSAVPRHEFKAEKIAAYEASAAISIRTKDDDE